jgi:hypothetical protein
MLVWFGLVCFACYVPQFILLAPPIGARRSLLSIQRQTRFASYAAILSNRRRRSHEFFLIFQKWAAEPLEGN